MTPLSSAPEGQAVGSERRPCRVEDIFDVAARPPADLLDALNGYLSQFAAPVRRDGRTYCVSCDQPVSAMMQAIGFGVAYRWGLAHGEAACSGCGWPARGIHRICDQNGQEITVIRDFFLAYLFAPTATDAATRGRVEGGSSCR